jgi:hypothetical protein
MAPLGHQKTVGGGWPLLGRLLTDLILETGHAL